VITVMTELEQVVAAWGQQRQICVLATVVKTAGSTYRRPGAHMLLALGAEDGMTEWLAGTISGGCLERDLIQKAAWHTQDGNPALVMYDARRDDDDDDHPREGFGMGCNGATWVLLERIAPPADDVGAVVASVAPDRVLAFARDCLRQRQRGVVATVIEAGLGDRVHLGDRLWLGAADTGVDSPAIGGLTDGALAAAIEARARALLAEGHSCRVRFEDVEVFFEVIAPARSLVICGSGFDVLPVVQLAKIVGWHVTVVDSRISAAAMQRLAAADRVICASLERLSSPLQALGPDAAAVVMTHNEQRDRAFVQLLLDSRVAYIGLLGPRQRTQRLVDDLPGPLDPAQLDRLHGPVGLDLGAEGAQEIALSIVAEVQAAFAQRPGASLSGGGYAVVRARAEEPSRAEAAE
jgi:xanthine dehydrogenase accessory factor